MVINVDKAAENILYDTSNFSCSRELRFNFAEEEYSFGRYVNTEADYFLVTNMSLRVFAKTQEHVVWYRDIRLVGLNGTFDLSSPPQLNKNWKRDLADPLNRLLRIELSSGAHVLLLVSGSVKDRNGHELSYDLFSVRKFIHNVVTRTHRAIRSNGEI